MRQGIPREYFVGLLGALAAAVLAFLAAEAVTQPRLILEVSLPILVLVIGMLVGLHVARQRQLVAWRKLADEQTRALDARARVKRNLIDVLVASGDGRTTEAALLAFVRESVGCTSLWVAEVDDGRWVSRPPPEGSTRVLPEAFADQARSGRTAREARPSVLVAEDGSDGWLVGCAVPSQPSASVLVVAARHRPDEDVLALVSLVATLIGAERLRQRDVEVLAKQRDEALAASRAKEEFLSNMSHEIRSPLTIVVGAADLLERIAFTEAQKRLINLMKTSSDRLLAVVDDVLDIAKIESGVLALRSDPFDLATLVETLVFAHRLQLNEGVTLDFAVADDVPRSLLGDPHRIEQVLGNLLSNASKFTHQGSIRVRVRCDGHTNGKASLEISVADTGMGIPRDKLGQFFERFMQVESRPTPRRGTGLGLAISRELVERMGGRITVDSELGKGSRFVVRLALETCEESPEIAPLLVTKDVPPPASPARVLLAEDTPEIACIVEGLLRDEGIEEVTVVSDGLAAASHARLGSFSLILLDLRLPLLDGLGAAASIRETERESERSPTPIVALTADATATTRRSIMANGFDACVTKPIRLSELQAMLDRFVPGARRTQRNSGAVDPGVQRAAPSSSAYLSRRMADVSRLTEALGVSDFETITDIAHAIRGSGASYGFPELTRVGSALEATARDRSSADVAERVRELRSLVERSLAMIA